MNDVNSKNENRVMRTLTLLLLIVLSATPHVSAASKPNIVFIFADDWGWGDLSCHGHPYVKTPNIDRLAKEGTDFHRFTVASGVCSPSRTAVMKDRTVNGTFASISPVGSSRTVGFCSLLRASRALTRLVNCRKR